MTLRDMPPDAAGIPWEVWHEQQIDRIFAEARDKRRHSEAPEPAKALPFREQQVGAPETRNAWLLDPSYTE